MTLISRSFRRCVDRAAARCSGGHGFDSCPGLIFFSLFHARVILISSLFTILTIIIMINKNGHDYHNLYSKVLQLFSIFYGYCIDALYLKAWEQ